MLTSTGNPLKLPALRRFSKVHFTDGEESDMTMHHRAAVHINILLPNSHQTDYTSENDKPVKCSAEAD